MSDRGHLLRRRFLAGLSSGGAIALAGCAESDTGSESDTRSGNNTESDADGGASVGSESEPPATDDLDLEEANVVDVAFEATGGGYALDVTLHHDDEGEEGYANWWQVEGLDGSRLGRRELLHAHSEQPFTRSETVGVPADVDCVVVRGHDATHGYGGVAALVSLSDGATRFADQGAAPRSFSEADCP
ncbi:hypothetical protein [Halorubrum sp. SP9]|uniref:hypothetical protein n=1 Tax=Halorubrum sp. SP9 TaxID=1537267 RepID=UPI0010F6613D|nr:hypothetical protein [Halorubrum sp. SP9]TKX66981.1 hypothetical protein EXE45_14600 [Halorubrum sp. SP9]